MAGSASVEEQIRQLNDARKLVLADVKFYPDVVKGILPILQPNTLVELRRWGADFLAEAFATPALSVKEKETMQVSGVIDTLETVLNNPNEDLHVLRSIILACASIYPVTLRWTIENSYDNITWEKMTAIKSRIFTIWETASISVRICCIKFAQRVVLAQTPSIGLEAKRNDSMDVSLDRITANHALLDPRMMEAEAHGLLDRIMGTLQDSKINVVSGEGLLIDATLNCLAILVRGRQNIGNRILNIVLNFDPYQNATGTLSAKEAVMMKSLVKTIRIFLIGFMKRDPQNPFSQRIHQRLEWLTARGSNATEDAGRKRPLEPLQQPHSDPKRQRTAQPPPSFPPPPPQQPEEDYETAPLGPGPHTLGDVFTLTKAASDTVKNFDVHTLPPPLVSRIVISALASISPHVLNRKIGDVRQRLEHLKSSVPPPLPSNTAVPPLVSTNEDDDDDDYEPDFDGPEDDDQTQNKMVCESTQVVPPTNHEASLSLEAFKLATAPPLTRESATGMGQVALQQVFEDCVVVGDDSMVAKKSKVGWRQFAAHMGDRDSWITTLIRIASRGSSEIQHDKPIKSEIKTDNESEDEDTKTGGVLTAKSLRAEGKTLTLNTDLRDMIFEYVMADFRKRIDVAVTWLCEEWYNDQIQLKYGQSRASSDGGHGTQYHQLVLRVLDGFLPYLHPGDRVLTRFLSEIPELSEPILTRVKQTCRDPTVVSLVLNSLLYLVMMRPPIKELALDAIQDIWLDVEDARNMAGKYLGKFRPEWLSAAIQNAENKTTTTNNEAEVPVA
ncbi:mRNA cleavage and polyadenylation specificity factor complex subunit pta1 [Ceratocystis lukuohia]|uniref:mRNA cleavage and polyadenylation specificity factor complex subunit pta1 n=1 Tax=Ceratocystis lukuohia TaxID=2019550 RepID=A0ABR4MTS8_9PEZI